MLLCAIGVAGGSSGSPATPATAHMYRMTSSMPPWLPSSTSWEQPGPLPALAPLPAGHGRHGVKSLGDVEASGDGGLAVRGQGVVGEGGGKDGSFNAAVG